MKKRLTPAEKRKAEREAAKRAEVGMKEKVADKRVTEEGLKESPTRIGDYRARKEVKFKDDPSFRLHEAVIDLADKYKFRLSEKYPKRKTVGTYWMDMDLVRTKGILDIDTVVHEVTHKINHFEKISEGLKKTELETELRRAYLNEYPSPKESASVDTQMSEGLSMIVQRFVADYDYVKRVYPGLYSKLINPQGEYYNTLLGEFIQDMNIAVGKYQSLSPLGKVEAITERESGTVIENPDGDLASIAPGRWEKMKLRIKEFVHYSGAVHDKIQHRRIQRHSEQALNELGEPLGDYSLWLEFGEAFQKFLGKNFDDPGAGFKVLDMDAQGEATYKQVEDYNWASVAQHMEQNWTESQRSEFGAMRIARDQHYQYKYKKDLIGLQELAEKTEQRLAQEVKELKEKSKDKKLIAEAERTLKSIKAKVSTLQTEINEISQVLQNNPLTEQEVEAAFKTIPSRYRAFPEYKEYMDKIDKLHDRTIDMLSHPFVMIKKPQEVAELKEKHKGYTSMRRVFVDKYTFNEEAVKMSEQVGVTGRYIPEADKAAFKDGYTQQQKKEISALNQRTGGKYVIRYPFAASFVAAREIQEASIKQAIYNQMGNAKIWEVAPELARRVEYKPGIEQDPRITTYYTNYKKQAMEMDPWVKRLTDDLVVTPATMNSILKVFRAGTRAFEVGTVSAYYPFTLNNFLFLDQSSAYALTPGDQATYKPYYTGLSTLTNIINSKIKGKENEVARYFQEYLPFAKRQTRLGWDQKALTQVQRNKMLKQESEAIEKVGKQIAKTGTLTLETLKAPSQFSESLTRGATYVQARQAGKPIMEALRVAGHSTGSYYKVGTWAPASLFPRLKKTKYKDLSFQDLVRTWPFFNPSMQMAFNTLQALQDSKRRPRTLFTMAVYGTIGLAATQAMRGADEEQRRAWLSKSPEEMAAFVWFPNFITGKGLLRFRTPQIFSIPSALLQMALQDLMFRKDGEAKWEGADYYNAAMTFFPDQFNPIKFQRWVLSLIPHAFSVPMAITLNKKTWPEPRDLIPQYMENLPPEEQVFDSTTPGAIWLGKRLNMSPIKIEETITQLVGRAANFFLLKEGVFNPLEQFVHEDFWVHRDKYIREIRERGHEIDYERRKIRAGDKELNPEEYIRLYGEKRAVNRVDKLVRLYSELLREDDEEKAAKVLIEIFELTDAHMQGKDILEDSDYEELETELNRLRKAEPIYDAGFEEVIFFAYPNTYNVDRRVRELERMFEKDSKRAGDFYDLIDATGLLTPAVKKRLTE